MKNSFEALRKGAIAYLHHHKDDTIHPLILEMMSLGRGVLALDTVMNRETTKEKALYYSDEGSLTNLFSSLEYGQRAHIGQSMQRIILSYHTWENIAERFDHAFSNLLNPQTSKDDEDRGTLLLEDNY